MRCIESKIMFGIEMFEEKGHPKELGRERGDEHGPTARSLTRLKKMLHGMGKIFMLDSGFYVLKGMIELKKLGVRASALVKKMRC